MFRFLNTSVLKQLYGTLIHCNEKKVTSSKQTQLAFSDLVEQILKIFGDFWIAWKMWNVHLIDLDIASSKIVPRFYNVHINMNRKINISLCLVASIAWNVIFFDQY